MIAAQGDEGVEDLRPLPRGRGLCRRGATRGNGARAGGPAGARLRGALGSDGAGASVTGAGAIASGAGGSRRAAVPLPLPVAGASASTAGAAQTLASRAPSGPRIIAAAVPASARSAMAATASLSRPRPKPKSPNVWRGVALQGMPDPTLHLGHARGRGRALEELDATPLGGIVATLIAQPFHRVSVPVPGLAPSSGTSFQNAFRAWWSRVQTVPRGMS